MPRAASLLRVWAWGWKKVMCEAAGARTGRKEVVCEAAGARTGLGAAPDGAECNRAMWTLKEGRYELHITSHKRDYFPTTAYPVKLNKTKLNP